MSDLKAVIRMLEDANAHIVSYKNHGFDLDRHQALTRINEGREKIAETRASEAAEQEYQKNFLCSVIDEKIEALFQLLRSDKT